MRPVLLALAVGAVLAPPVRAGDPRNFDDAALHAVQFIDKNYGWVVGDEGVVWYTINGGKDWERQPTGTRASLRSVHFLNPYLGWIVGREELPGGGSAGVLLFTEDSGVKWQRILANAMPGLNQVRFLNEREGFIIGDGSDQFPTGIFQTVDGGHSWKPVKGPRSPGWRAADFQDGQTGALVGAWGRLAKMRHGAVGMANVDALGGRMLCGLQVVGNRAVAVGEGGAVLVSRTSGANWGYAESFMKLPADVRASLDFRGLHCAGDHAWAVGRPGSVLLHSPNLGTSWELLKTGHSLPLNGVYFLNERRGWAVGDFGSILATEDGGKTWSAQRRGGLRAAVLFVHARASGLPVDTLSLLGGEEGYLTAALRVAGPDSRSAAAKHAADGQRFAAAARLAGGAAGEMLWQFPIAQHSANAGKEEMLRDWNRLHGNRADRELLRQLVLALRLWRPDVVVTDHPDAKLSGSAADALVAEALHEAFSRAADPRAFPEQLEALGLEAWSVSKVYARWHELRGAQVVVDLTEVKPRLENTARDFAAPAANLLEDALPPLRAQRYYHLLDSKSAEAENQRGLMDGTHLGEGGEARRKLGPVAVLKPEIEKAIRDRRAFQRLAENPADGLTNPSQILSRIGPALAALPVDQGAAALHALASNYARQGQWALAREAFILMIDRYPAHPRAADAYRWLIRHNSSSEARRRHELGQFLVVTEVGPEQGTSAKGVGENTTRTRLANRQEASMRVWNRSSLEVGNRLAAFGPLYASDPAVQFCLQAARRQLGEWESARKWYTHFVQTHSDGPWRDAAAAELWLGDRRGPAPKPVAFCRQTVLRPFLDGELDDSCWQGNAPLVLGNAVGETAKAYPTEVRLAYDQDFLYLALRCRHPAGRRLPPVKARKRDEDLRAFDRVSLLLDLDRDYSTYFHFQVDERGCVFEDCWGDRTWDPRWFVAVRSDNTCWCIEAAIPLVELTGDRITLGNAWAFNVVRILPGRGVQAFSMPANVEPRPEGMGLLLFTQDPSQAAPRLPGQRPIARVP